MRTTSLVIAAVLLASIIALAQNITYDYDKSVDFSTLKTYAWIQGTEVPDQFNHARVVDAVSAQLASKGLKQVELSGHPDLWVAYHAVFDRDLRISGFSNGFGPYRLGGSRSGSARTEEILVGTLVVDLVDSQTSTILWRGIASKEIDVNANPSKRERNINRAAERLFKNYPPVK